MVLGLATGLLLGGVPVNTIWVAAPPDVAPCTVEVLAQAFRVRFGRVSVLPGEHDLAAGEMQVVLRPAGKGLELRVRAAGERKLVRELPGPGTACLAASETIALMVERYLDEVGAGIAVPAAPPILPLGPPPPPPPWGVALEGTVTAELAVLPQLAPGESTTIPALGIGGAIAIGVRRGPWQILARGTLEPAGATTVAGSVPGAVGTLHLQAAAAALAGAYLLAAGPGEVRFELAPGAQLVWGNTTTSNGGAFGTIGSSFSTLPFVGVGVGYAVPLWEHLSAVAEVSMRVHLGTTELEVQGVPADTVYTRQLDGEASVGLGYVFY